MSEAQRADKAIINAMRVQRRAEALIKEYLGKNKRIEELEAENAELREKQQTSCKLIEYDTRALELLRAETVQLRERIEQAETELLNLAVIDPEQIAADVELVHEPSTWPAHFTADERKGIADALADLDLRDLPPTPSFLPPEKPGCLKMRVPAQMQDDTVECRCADCLEAYRNLKELGPKGPGSCTRCGLYNIRWRFDEQRKVATTRCVECGLEGECPPVIPVPPAIPADGEVPPIFDPDEVGK